MFCTTLLKLFCSFITLQLVLTQNDLGEVIKKLRSNENLTPEWMDTYLETLKNLDYHNNMTLSDLRSLEKFLNYLNEDQSRLLVEHINKFLQELIHSSYKFESKIKIEREPRKLNLNENEGSGYAEDDDDVKQILNQIFTDFFLLKSKLIDLSKNVPLLIEMMEQNNGEISEQETEALSAEGNSMDVRTSDNKEENLTAKHPAGRTNFIGLKIKWIRQKAGVLSGILSRYHVFDNVRNLHDYLQQEQGNTAEVEELEEEIEDLLSEYEESDEPLFYWQEPEIDQMETENLIEIEDGQSVMSRVQESQSAPEELVTDEETSDTNREARKLFHKIKIEEESEHALNESPENKDGGSVKIFRKTFKIFSKDKAKDQPKETSVDEKWKVEVYNKVFKDNTNKENEAVADQTHYAMTETQTKTEGNKATNAGETSKENVFEKIFGKGDIKISENGKENKEWKIKKNFKKIIGTDDATKMNKNGKSMTDKTNQKQMQNDGLFKNEAVKQSQKELEYENSNYEDQSLKKSSYDKIRNKTNNITNYLGSITNDLYTAGNESLLREIIEAVRDGKEDLTKNVRQKFSNVAKSLFQSNSKVVESDESKIKPESGEKWSLGSLSEGFLNTKENITNRIKETFGNVKQDFNIKIDTLMEDSSKLSKKSKLDSLSPAPTEDKYMEKPSYITVTSTYYTVLLTTTTTDVVYERTVTFTSTEVIETLLNPTTTHAKSLSTKSKAAEKYIKQIESSSVMAENTETKSDSLKNVILDKFNLA